ncbi:hypothetical protein Misp01_16030 [Microtetraspora sp. NBRC 13810]|nr:hypothetical protein Misp01_16030 [Microtetraspora sp. NBRC 13810]
MGTVWRARARDTGEIVAVKLLRDSLSGDPDLVLRFVQERNVLRTLRHPNVITMRDFVVEGDCLALVMDLVDGGDLHRLLTRRGTLPPAEAAALMIQVADALTAAHAEGVVHRDVKPANILVEAGTGRVRLSDFGVARIVHGPRLTQTTSIIGTPTYLPPEVAEGRPPTAAMDVYATGLILYELLAGRPPFTGDHPMAVLRQHATAAPKRLPGMPDALWSVIIQCIAKDPAARPPIGHVAAALRAAGPSLAGLPALPPVGRGADPLLTSEPLAGEQLAPPAVPGAGTVPSRRRARSAPVLVTAVVAGALVVSAGVVVAVAPWQPADLMAAAQSATPPPEPTTTPTPAAPVTTPAVSSPEPKPSRSRVPRTARPEPTAEPSPPTRPSGSPTPRRTATRKETPPKEAPDPSSIPPTRKPRPTPTPTPEKVVPEYRCRAWVAAGKFAEISPCMAVVGDRFYLLGRVRGTGAARADVNVQLYNSDAETNVSQPYTCAGLALGAPGTVVTCGPFVVTSPPRSGGARTNVRQRWKQAGAATWSGGAESPWVSW